MEHDIHLGCFGEYHVPWVDPSWYSPHRKSSIVYYRLLLFCLVSVIYDKGKNLWNNLQWTKSVKVWRK